MKKYVFLVLLTIVLFGFCSLISAQDTEITEIPEGFVFYHYQYAYFDISLIYPEKWINYSSQERGIVIYTPDSKGTLTFRATPLFGEEYTLAELWAENMENLKLAGAVFLESVLDKLSGNTAQRTLFTMKFGDKVLKYIIYNTIVNDLYYSFNFSTQEADFEKYLNDILKIVLSIKINEKNEV
ncbi:hypothetical protein CVT91_03665 [Candidatus Atribacteria bacterium HGW-Atribacteria-1]|nr:MAG: hypothetical protein CVT91_03665 [Candidatus Atribacteria bacterium HGW-Atribacteria-1]